MPKSLVKIPCTLIKALIDENKVNIYLSIYLSFINMLYHNIIYDIDFCGINLHSYYNMI